VEPARKITQYTWPDLLMELESPSRDGTNKGLWQEQIRLEIINLSLRVQSAHIVYDFSFWSGRQKKSNVKVAREEHLDGYCLQRQRRRRTLEHPAVNQSGIARFCRNGRAESGAHKRL